jgi:hypothetical protein
MQDDFHITELQEHGHTIDMPWWADVLIGVGVIALVWFLWKLKKQR